MYACLSTATLQVKAAEAEAESKYLSGVGVSKQRKAIVDGLRDSVESFSQTIDGGLTLNPLAFPRWLHRGRVCAKRLSIFLYVADRFEHRAAALRVHPGEFCPAGFRQRAQCAGAARRIL